jgi:hypothetical protein
MMRRSQFSIVLILSISVGIAAFTSHKAYPLNTGANGEQASDKGQPLPPQYAANSVHQNGEEASCRAFVQDFYDWYWNQFAEKPEKHQLHTTDDVLQRKPSVVAPELARLLKKNEDGKSATGKIGNLDFDPFMNGNGGEKGKFLVTSVRVSNGTCRTTVKGSSEIRPELKKYQSTWKFVNFHYSFYSEDGKTKRLPDDDLMHILNR